MELVTLEQVRAHCRAEDADVSLLEVYAGAAELQAQDFLNRRVYPDAETMAAAVLGETAGEAPIVVNDAILAAVLLITGHLYLTREEVQTGQGAAAAQIPMGAHSLLWPYRVGLGV